MRLPRFQRFLGRGEREWTDWTQEEWDEWRRRNNEEWEEQERRRNEEWWAEETRRRDAEASRKREEDITRGHWVVSPELTDAEDQEWRELRYDRDLWIEVEKTDENGKPWKEWEITDPEIKARFTTLDKKRQEHIDTDNYKKCRLPPMEYYAIKDYVLENGLGTERVRFETASDGYKFVRIAFPDDYPWLLNNEFGRSQKATRSTGYHITICEAETYKTDRAAKEATDRFRKKWGPWWREIEMNEISVSSGDTYQIEGESQFARDLRETVAITLKDKGAGYKAHISQD